MPLFSNGPSKGIYKAKVYVKAFNSSEACNANGNLLFGFRCRVL